MKQASLPGNIVVFTIITIFADISINFPCKNIEATKSSTYTIYKDCDVYSDLGQSLLLLKSE